MKLLDAILENVAELPNTATKEELKEAMGPVVPTELVNAIANLARPARTDHPVRVSEDQFVKGLESMPGVICFATIGHLTTAKDSELIKPKKNGTSDRFKKLGVSQVIVNANYTKMVQTRIEKEGLAEQFDAAKRTWGFRVVKQGDTVYYVRPDPPLDPANGPILPVGLVYHEEKGLLYLETAWLRRIGPVYWYDNGNPVEWDEIARYFHPKREGKRQPQKQKVAWRTWGLDSIRTVSITPQQGKDRVTHRFVVQH
jgi:hypothetical protein